MSLPLFSWVATVCAAVVCAATLVLADAKDGPHCFVGERLVDCNMPEGK